MATTIKLSRRDYLRGYVRVAARDLADRGLIRPGDDWDAVVRRIATEFVTDVLRDAREGALEVAEPLALAGIERAATAGGEVLGGFIRDLFSRARDKPR